MKVEEVFTREIAVLFNRHLGLNVCNIPSSLYRNKVSRKEF